MKKDFAGVSLGRPEFERLSLLCLGDPAFPRRYEDWQHLVSEGESMAQSSGIQQDPVHVNVDFFQNWCAMTGVAPCLQALRALLIVERAGIHQGLADLSTPPSSPP